MPVSVANSILLLTGALLFYIAATEFGTYKIRNEVVLTIAVLFVGYAIATQDWLALVLNSLFATIVFVPMLYFYSMRLMGGGDLKLLSAAMLWVGPYCVLPFAVFMTFFILAHLALLRAKKAWQVVHEKTKSPALAPSIAAALIVVFMSGCLDEGARTRAVERFEDWASQLVYIILPAAPHTH